MQSIMQSSGLAWNALRSALVAAFAWILAASAAAAQPLTAEETTAIAKEAFVYGFPMVDSYAVLERYAFDQTSREYKGPVNTIAHARSVAGPDDRAFVAPNVDTPYSYAWLDLRTEPIVLTLPPFEARRYVSIQLIDAYTYILDYVTPRTNGDKGGSFLVAGPEWSGATPKGIARVVRSPTDIVLALYRTEVIGPDDMPRVHALQDQYTVEPLSAFLDTPPPAAAPPLEPVTPIDPRKVTDPAAFFTVLNWVLQYAPTLPDESDLRERIARIGVVPGKPFPQVDAATRAALLRGIAEGLSAMGARAKRVRSSAELFGNRDHLGRDYLIRAVAAMIGIYGNAAEEYLGVGYQADSEGRPFDGDHQYRIRFAPDAEPPVSAFWSITAYTADSYVYANAIDRHKIGSSMVPSLRKDPDGGFTLYLQHESPGPELEPNWLPVPATPFVLAFRTYLPGEAIRTGRWTAPPVVRVRQPRADAHFEQSGGGLGNPDP